MGQRRRAVAVLTMLAGGISAVVGLHVTPARADTTVQIPVTFRDFDHPVDPADPPHGNAPTKHADFEYALGDDGGIVTNTLGSDNKPVYGDHPSGTATTHSAALFNQWYHDDATVNTQVPISLAFNQTPDGHVHYDSQSFFPLDDKGWNDPSKGSNPQVDDTHNFSFTMEMHTTFTYHQGDTFSFTGDDDVWVYLNKHLAIDLGGVHSAESSSVTLDSVAGQFGMTVGQSYPLDLFYAERHTSGSDFTLDTSLALAPAAATASSTTTTAAGGATTTTAAAGATTTTTQAVATTVSTSNVLASTVTGKREDALVWLGLAMLFAGAVLLAGRRIADRPLEY